MRTEIKSCRDVIKSGITCFFVSAALAVLIISGGCGSGSRPSVQPAVELAVRPSIATNEQVGFVADGTEMISPVSGDKVTKSNQTPALIYKDRLYFFCCQRHMREFAAKPEQYINTVSLPNGMDIHGAKPGKPVAVAAAAPKQRTSPDPNAVYNIDVGESPVRGAKDAPVTIVEFVDMQCPYCIREWPKLKQILSEYPQKVRVVFKHYPLSFHKKAKPAHAAMELALKQEGDDGFWKMHDLILSNPAKLDPNDLRGYAQTIQLDMDVFDAVMGDPTKIDALIVPSLLEGRKYGVRGTPTIFINGKRLFSRTLDSYKARINQILSQGDTKG